VSVGQRETPRETGPGLALRVRDPSPCRRGRRRPLRPRSRCVVRSHVLPARTRASTRRDRDVPGQDHEASSFQDESQMAPLVGLGSRRRRTWPSGGAWTITPGQLVSVTESSRRTSRAAALAAVTASRGPTRCRRTCRPSGGVHDRPPSSRSGLRSAAATPSAYDPPPPWWPTRRVTRPAWGQGVPARFLCGLATGRNSRTEPAALRPGTPTRWRRDWCRSVRPGRTGRVRTWSRYRPSWRSTSGGGVERAGDGGGGVEAPELRTVPSAAVSVARSRGGGSRTRVQEYVAAAPPARPVVVYAAARGRATSRATPARASPGPHGSSGRVG